MVKKRINWEAQEQRALFKMARCHPITRDYMWSSQGGAKRTAAQGLEAVRQGLKKGVPDIFLAYPMGEYSGLFIELKRLYPSKGTASPEQLIMISNLTEVGYRAKLAYGWIDAWNKICDYLHLEQKHYIEVKHGNTGTEDIES